MALTILSNLSYNGKNPNFERDRVATLEALLYVNPANQEYDYGHIVFCEEDGKHYRFMHKYGAPDEANYNDTTGWFKEFVAEGTGDGSIDTSNFATKSDLESKQNVISDLATIRSGAANGATAVQTVRINNEPFTQPESGKLTLQFKTINNQSITGSGNIEIGSGSSGGGIISETDPIFKASPAAGIKYSDIAAWNNKSNFSGNYDDLSNKPTIPSAVTEEIVSGWDFTKNKGTVTGVKINGNAGPIDTNGVVDLGYIDSGGGDTIINGVTDVTVGGASVVSNNKATIPNASTSAYGVTKLTDAIDKDDSSLAATAKAVSIINANKQDKISDLETIRTDSQNAFKGTINGETTGDLDVVTSVNGVSPNRGAVTIGVGDKNVQSDWNATSGDAFIKNKPTIPAAVTEDTVTGWGFTKNTGTYSKPDGGIPTTDLANDVQEKINKADNAFIGSVNGSKDGGFFTVEKIVMNNNDYERKGSETHIDLGTVLTEHQDLSDYLTTTTAANTYLKKTANAASATKATQDGNGNNIADTYATKTALNEGLNSKQDTITDLEAIRSGAKLGETALQEGDVDLSNYVTKDMMPEYEGDGVYFNDGNDERPIGFTIFRGEGLSIDEDGALQVNTDDVNLRNRFKTINGNSIFGSGNIITNAYPLVNHGASDTTFELTPNTFHVWSTVASLALTLGSGTDGVANEYLFQFSCLSGQATTLGLPEGIMWANGEAPTLEVLKTYQVSILNNCATYVSFG